MNDYMICLYLNLLTDYTYYLWQVRRRVKGEIKSKAESKQQIAWLLMEIKRKRRTDRLRLC